MRLLALVSALASGSCASLGEIARQRFAAEYRCRVVVVESLGRRAYRAIGCGYEAVYVCRTPEPGEGVCTRLNPLPATAPPAAAPPYAWPPAEGRLYEHYDEFERQTIVQADMTVAGRVLRFFGAPRRAADDVFLDMMFPNGSFPGPTCNELLVIVGSEVVRIPVAAALSGTNGEPLVRFQISLVALDRGVASGVVKCRFCGVDWQLDPGQVQILGAFATRLREVRALEAPPDTPSPAIDAGPAAPSD